MSLSPFFYLEVYDSKLDKWLYVDPLVWNYDHTKRIPADLWPYNGAHEMFDILGVDRGLCSCDFGAVRTGLPPGCNEEIAKVFVDTGNYSCPKAHWFTYADMEIYLLKNPTVKDYDFEPDDDNKFPQKDNPLKMLKDRIDAFLEVWDTYGVYSQYRSDIRVVFDVV